MNPWVLRQPEALLAWLLLGLLWWRARRSMQAPIEWTGALAIWKRVPRVDPAASPAAFERHALPWSARLALCAFAVGVLALSDPVQRGRPAPLPAWTLVLDRSPAMFLSLDTGAGAPTRITRALELALRLCAEQGVPATGREWITHTWDGVARSRSERPPAGWLTPDWELAQTVPWASLDQAATLWISDCAPKPEPLFAGLVQSGASPIPGPCADLGGEFWQFDGQDLVREPWGPGRSGLALDGVLPDDVATLARLWAQSRSLPVVGPGQRAGLRLIAAEPAPKARTGLLSHGSWAVPATATPMPWQEGLRTWARFSPEGGEPVAGVAWRPGVVRLGVDGLSAAQADPSAWAMDWCLLFDAACLPEPGVVPLALRQRSALGSSRPPAAGQAQALGSPPGAPRALLAGLAGLLALGSLALRLRVGGGATIPADRVRSFPRTGLS